MNYYIFQILPAFVIFTFWTIGGSLARAEVPFSCNLEEYQVPKTECLSVIGKKLNVSVHTLRLFNNINNSRVRTGTKIYFPSFSTPIIFNSQELVFQNYRIYTANLRVFLCGVTKGSEKQEVYIFEKVDNYWQSIGKVECSGLPNLIFEVQMNVRDIDKDNHDECYIFRAYGCSAKDVCFEGFYHIPAKSDHLHGVSIDTYLFNQENQIHGRQKISFYYGNMGKTFEPTLYKYKDFLLRRLEALIEKYLPTQKFIISRHSFEFPG